MDHAGTSVSRLPPRLRWAFTALILVAVCAPILTRYALGVNLKDGIVKASWG